MFFIVIERVFLLGGILKEGIILKFKECFFNGWIIVSDILLGYIVGFFILVCKFSCIIFLYIVKVGFIGLIMFIREGFFGWELLVCSLLF